MTVGISSFLGFSSTSDSAWLDPDAGAAVRWPPCSLFAGGFGDAARPWTPRLRLGERQCRKALNCRSSSPSRFPRDVRRTGLLRLGSSRLRRERVAGERWKDSSEASPLVSTMDGSLGSCSDSKTGSWKKTMKSRANAVKLLNDMSLKQSYDKAKKADRRHSVFASPAATHNLKIFCYQSCI